MIPSHDCSGLVLVVDDEEAIRDVLSQFIGETYECVTAASAEEALALLPTRRFDVVLSDIQMSGMTGLQMVPRILDTSPETVIVMISGLQSMDAAIEAMRAGAFDYVTKPFALEQVELVVARAVKHHALRVAKRIYETRLEEMVAQRTSELHDALGRTETAYRMTLKALTSALDMRDTETAGHSERVVAFSLRLGRELGFGAEALRSLEYGALLHDIGKVGVPDAILRKPAPLDEGEWQQMRRHPLFGQEILRGIDFLEGAARIVAQHHEKCDGSGYPLGLKEEEIDPGARVFAVADAFDAMTSDRVYRRGRSYELAREELGRCVGAHFDAQVVEAFKRVPSYVWDELRAQSAFKARERKLSDKLQSNVPWGHSSGLTKTQQAELVV